MESKKQGKISKYPKERKFSTFFIFSFFGLGFTIFFPSNLLANSQKMEDKKALSDPLTMKDMANRAVAGEKKDTAKVLEATLSTNTEETKQTENQIPNNAGELTNRMRESRTAMGEE